MKHKSKRPLIFAFPSFFIVVWTENICCIFRVKPNLFKIPSGKRGLGLSKRIWPKPINVTLTFFPLVLCFPYRFTRFHICLFYKYSFWNNGKGWVENVAFQWLDFSPGYFPKNCAGTCCRSFDYFLQVQTLYSVEITIIVCEVYLSDVNSIH